MQGYQELENKLKDQPKDSLDRLKSLRKEAQELLDKAEDSKRKLAGRGMPQGLLGKVKPGTSEMCHLSTSNGMEKEQKWVCSQTYVEKPEVFHRTMEVLCWERDGQVVLRRVGLCGKGICVGKVFRSRKLLVKVTLANLMS